MLLAVKKLYRFRSWEVNFYIYIFKRKLQKIVNRLIFK